MCNEDFPLDSSEKDETITITLTVEDVYHILQEAQSPEGAMVVAANRTLWGVVMLICMEVMTAAERAAVWRYVEGLVGE